MRRRFTWGLIRIQPSTCLPNMRSIILMQTATDTGYDFTIFWPSRHRFFSHHLMCVSTYSGLSEILPRLEKGSEKDLVNRTRDIMATGGEVGGKSGDTLGSEDLKNLKCQPCQEDGKVREAVGLCIDCQEYLCQSCFDIHCIPKPMRGHQLLDKQQMLKSQVRLARKDKCSERCSQHDDEFVKYYCKIHCKLVCSVCLNLSHRKCKDALYIPDVAKDLANSAEFKQVEGQLASLLAKSKKVYTDTKQKLSAFDDSYTRAIKMMEDFRQEMNDAVDKIQTELRKEAADRKTTESKRIGIMTDICEKVAKELESKITTIETFRKSKQSCNVFTETMSMKNKLDLFDGQLKDIEMVKSVNTGTIKFNPNYGILDTLKQSKAFGTLTVTGGKEQAGKATGRKVKADTRTVVKAGHIHDIHVKSRDDRCDCCITGSTILPNNKVIVCDNNNNTIKAVDVQQARVSTQLKVSSRPWDVAAIDKKTAAVTLPYGKKVVFVTVCASMTVDRDLPVGGECWGIDYRDGKLALSFLYPDQVKVLNLKGTVLHNITTDKAGRAVLNVPQYLALSPNDTSLYVSNHTSNNVVCVNLDGTVKASYTDSELRGPEKVVADRHGNIYVVARDSNTLHQLTADCQKTKVLLTAADGLQRPYTVSYSETENKLVVGTASNTVKVYKTVLG